MSEKIVWSADWCMPCKGLKHWLKDNHPNVIINDVDKFDTLPVGLKSVPTLEDNGKLIVGSEQIKEHLNKQWREKA